MKGKESLKIGFIGQGYIGKNYADDFEERGFSVVRYALEEPYKKNKEALKSCPIVFIAVPTPTTTRGFDDAILRGTMDLFSNGTSVVIKSTIIPGTTASIQKDFPGLFIFHSPEFLTKKTAAYDARNPERNIIGTPKDTTEYRKRAKKILDLLPKAQYETICKAQEAEILKYASNVFGYTKVVFMNLLYNLSEKHNCDWDVLKKAMAADSKIGTWHLDPVHKGGRGAGGICFIKDFEAFRRFYADMVSDQEGIEFLNALLKKNKKLLKDTNKDFEILRGVYGDDL